MLGPVRTATISEVIARIDEEAASAPDGALAFDGDGTLWSGDVGEDFFAALIEAERVLRPAHEALAREARAEGLDASGSPTDLARRIHAAYIAGTFPEERVCEIMTWAFAGWRASDVDAFARDVLSAVGLEARLHHEAIRIVEHARTRGLDVYLVSASPRAVVHAAARIVGIEAARIASATEVTDAAGVVLCEVDRPIPYGPGKVKRLRDKLRGRPLLSAFGDNAFDVALLSAARVPIAIRPKARLVDRAAEVPGLATLERLERPAT